MTYLIWSETEEGEEHHALYDQSNRALVRTAPLYGTAFQTDNYDLFQLLVSWASGGMAEAYVDKFRHTKHGGNAWMRILKPWRAKMQRTRAFNRWT